MGAEEVADVLGVATAAPVPREAGRRRSLRVLLLYSLTNCAKSMAFLPKASMTAATYGL